MYKHSIVKREESLFDAKLVKEYFRIDGSYDDNIVLISKDFAGNYAFLATGICISPTIFAVTTNKVINSVINVNVGPIISIIEIYRNGELLREDIDYSLTFDTNPHGSINLLTAQKNGIFKIKICCGYKSLDLMPIELKSAVLMQALYHYENRAGNGGTVAPKMVDILLNTLCKLRV